MEVRRAETVTGDGAGVWAFLAEHGVLGDHMELCLNLFTFPFFFFLIFFFSLIIGHVGQAEQDCPSRLAGLGTREP